MVSSCTLQVVVLRPWIGSGGSGWHVAEGLLYWRCRLAACVLLELGSRGVDGCKRGPGTGSCAFLLGEWTVGGRLLGQGVHMLTEGAGAG